MLHGYFVSKDFATGCNSNEIDSRRDMGDVNRHRLLAFGSWLLVENFFSVNVIDFDFVNSGLRTPDSRLPTTSIVSDIHLHPLYLLLSTQYQYFHSLID